MEMEMAEHSLGGWGLMLATWTGTTTLSSWAGAHFVADQNVGTMSTLLIHIVFGLLSLPVLMMVIWYPQRMLGQDTVVRTKAAIAADAELMVQTETTLISNDGKSICPECNTEVGISRSKSGEIIVPCATEGCTGQSAIGKTCPRCKATTPTRYDCPSCGINAPVLDFLSDVEVW
jgi:RNA polymerase subunit RPABC4/transcription elongation factor Spt4